MAAIVETLIICDGGPECPRRDEPLTNMANRHLSANKQRQSYEAVGWRYFQGKDLCPACVARLHLKPKVLTHRVCHQQAH